MQPLRYLMMIAFIFLVSCQNIQEEANVEPSPNTPTKVASSQNTPSATKPEVEVETPDSHWHSKKINTAVFSPNSKFILSGSEDKTLILWDVSTGRWLRTFKGHSDSVSSVAFSPDGKLALSGSNDNTMKLWEVSTGRELRTFKGHSDSVYSVAFSPDGKLALSGSNDNTMLWEVSTGRKLRTFDGYTYKLAFNPDGKSFWSAGYTSLTLWDVLAGRKLKTVKIYDDSGEVNGDDIAFSTSSKSALASNDGFSFSLWNLSTGRYIDLKLDMKTLPDDIVTVIKVGLSPNGKLALISCSTYDSSFFHILYDVSTGRKLWRTRAAGIRAETFIAFSPSGKLIAAPNNINSTSGGYYHLEIQEVSTGNVLPQWMEEW